MAIVPNTVLVNKDYAGGLIVGLKQKIVRVDSLYVSVVGDSVQGHGPGIHAGPVMATGSDILRIERIPVCRGGPVIQDIASCGHPAVADCILHNE
jgi:uncharacterized Zn-binding protein involved in type VI secretion